MVLTNVTAIPMLEGGGKITKQLDYFVSQVNHEIKKRIWDGLERNFQLVKESISGNPKE